MRRIVRFTIALILLSVFIFNCEDREIHYAKSLPFIFDAWRSPQNSVIYVREEVPISLEIRYDNKSGDHEFYISTSINRMGQLRQNGALVRDWKTEKTGEIPLIFTPLDTGEYVIYFDVVDRYEHRERDSLVFNVKRPPFSFRLSESETKVFKGQHAEPTMELKELEKVKDSRYAYEYLDESDGKLYVDGKLLKSKKVYPLKPGKYKLRYEPNFNKEGTRILTFIVRGRRGQKLYETYKVSVVKNKIAVELTSDKSVLARNQTATITLKATPSHPLNKPYKLLITSDRAIDLLDKSNKEFFLGRSIEVQDLKEKRYRFVPKNGEVGTYNLSATYTDAFGDQYTDTLSISVGQQPVKLSLKSDKQEIYINDSALLTISLSPLSSDENAAYSFRIYASEKQAIFKNAKGEVLDPNTFYPLGVASAVTSFSSSLVGAHSIFVEVENNHDGQRKTVTFNIKVKTPPTWEIMSDAPNTVQAGWYRHFKIKFKGTAGSTWLFAQSSKTGKLFEFKRNSKDVLLSTNTPYTINGDDKILEFNYTNLKKNTAEQLTFTLVTPDRYSVYFAVTIRVTDPPRFEVSLKRKTDSIPVGQSAEIVFDITNARTPSGVEMNLLKTLSCSSEQKGKAFYSGKDLLNPGSLSKVNIQNKENQVKVVFQPQQPGENVLTFTFEDITGQTVVVKVSIEVVYPFKWELKGFPDTVKAGQHVYFVLNFEGESGVTGYKWRYSKTSIYGLLLRSDSDFEMLADTDYPIASKEKLQLDYLNDMQVGKKEKLTFKLIPSKGPAKVISHTFKILPPPRFKVTLIPDTSEADGHRNIPVKFRIDSDIEEKVPGNKVNLEKTIECFSFMGVEKALYKGKNTLDLKFYEEAVRIDKNKAHQSEDTVVLVLQLVSDPATDERDNALVTVSFRNTVPQVQDIRVGLKRISSSNKWEIKDVTPY